MIEGITLKVCGITSLPAARASVEAGADYLGFNFYPKSPRYLTVEQYAALAPELPPVRRTAVAVEPTAAEIQAFLRAGFDAVQIHHRHDIGTGALTAWSKAIGIERLWLAPRLPPEADVPLAWLGLARTVMLDTFQPDLYGGTGHAGDWAKFARHRIRHPDTKWILAGGLKAENIGPALRESGARLVDVNSGVESSPGVKDPGKIRAFAAALRNAARAPINGA